MPIGRIYLPNLIVRVKLRKVVQFGNGTIRLVVKSSCMLLGNFFFITLFLLFQLKWKKVIIIGTNLDGPNLFYIIKSKEP